MTSSGKIDNSCKVGPSSIGNLEQKEKQCRKKEKVHSGSAEQTRLTKTEQTSAKSRYDDLRKSLKEYEDLFQAIEDKESDEESLSSIEEFLRKERFIEESLF